MVPLTIRIFLLHPIHNLANHDEVKPQSLEVVVDAVANVNPAPTSAECELGIIFHS